MVVIHRDVESLHGYTVKCSKMQWLNCGALLGNRVWFVGLGAYLGVKEIRSGQLFRQWDFPAR